jgi:hypothetical protein
VQQFVLVLVGLDTQNLPHKLLLLKLEAYSMSKSALQLIENYLTNRKQCVKVGTTSNWQDIYKGVPDFLPIARACNLSGFAFIWLHENHSINAKLSFSKCSTTLSILSSACVRVLSSA